MDAYQQYIHKSRYARYLPEEQRRESWEETVKRYVDYWGEKLSEKEHKEVFKAGTRSRSYAFNASVNDRW
jgi:hypothetical protein